MDASLLALLLGGAIGLILALTGAGGGILAVPALLFGLHLTMAQAAPVGLIAVGLASALGAMLGLRDGIVRYRAAGLIGSAGLVLAPVGVYLARVLPDRPLMLAFAGVLGWVAWRMWRIAHRPALAPHADAPAPGRPPPCLVDPDDGRLAWTAPCARALAATGALSGLLSGLLGVGGGFVIVPALTRFTNLPPRSILATSLAVIALVSVGGVAAAALQGAVAWQLAAPFALGAMVALLAGRRVAARLAGAHLQRAFAVTCVGVALLLIARAMHWITLARR